MTTRTLTIAAAALLAAQFGTAQRERAPKHEFTMEVEHKRLPALSQGRAGTCWSFATTSFLESEVERIHGMPIDLSELHTVYFTYLEKARRYVKMHGKAQFSQGGLSHDVIEMVSRYGVVRQKDYSGLPNGAQFHDHDQLEKVLKAVVDEVKESPRLDRRWDDAVQGVLSAYLGTPPLSIDVDGKSRTPMEYAHADLKIPANEYRQLMSYQSQPQWSQECLYVPDNWMTHDDYWNVPLEALLDNLDHALHSGYTAAIDIDVSERGTRRGDYVWTLPKAQEKDGAITDEVRQAMFDSRETTDDHLMHIVGRAKNQDGKIFYLTKNSHGNGGPYDGHVYISRNYIAAKMLSFMVHKDALVRETKQRIGD